MMQQAFEGFIALPAPRGTTDKTWWQVLELSSSDVSIPEIEVAWKRLAKEHHPDNGGDPDRMAEINVAKRKGFKYNDV